MRVYGRSYHGYMLTDAGRTALWLDETAPVVVLRFAFVEQGVETSLFPAFILDDWGNELKGRRMYRWFREFADQFPRAEVFGRTLEGVERQRFVRELEVYARPRCYGYPDKESALADGRLIAAVLLPDPDVGAPQKLKRAPGDTERLLRGARLDWWRVPPTWREQFSFSNLA